jgi:3-oxoacyl-[acyl-carrier protein] reductase
MMHTVRAGERGDALAREVEGGVDHLISSVSGREIDFTGPAYGAFKAALVHYAQGLAFKLAGRASGPTRSRPGNTYFDGGIWQWIETTTPSCSPRR